MTRSGGKGKGGPKKDGQDIGRALIKMHLAGGGKLKPRYANKMVSILDATALDDFIDSAEMEGKDFEVKRVHQNHAFLLEATTHKSIQALSFSAFKHEQLSIPRKPAWTKKMSAEDVDRNEKNAFLQWRREIAAIEGDNDHEKKVTPFEKNLEVWRQLWRVVERSDLVIQIVDARNPLLYYTKDLMTYVSELNPPKKMLLLVNKADYLTEYQRLVWAQYFNAIGVRFAFYSAHNEQNKLDAFGFVEDFELNDVDEEEIVFLAKDIVQNYSLDVGKNAEHVKFDSTASDSYLESERCRAEEAAAVQAALEQSRIEAIPEATEEEGENDDTGSEEGSGSASEGEDDAPGASQEAVLKPSAEASAPAQESTAEVADEDDAGEDDNLAAYVKNAKQRAESADESDEDGEGEENSDGTEVSSDGRSVEEKATGAALASRVATAGSTAHAAATSMEQRRARLLTRAELLLLLETVSEELRLTPQPRHDGRICIGLVGYPNVGKSSCINTLLGVSKSSHGKVRVGVSSTPGKTKHFQTLVLSDTMMLCDCPGLVFPSFMNSTGEMLCAGILPINQMRDYQEPAAVIASRIPQYLLEAALGIKIYRHLDPLDKKDRPPTASEMLGSYCESRGYITNGTGRWDEFRACKDMLVWYTDGKLLNVSVPPFADMDTNITATTSTTSSHAATTLRGSILPRWVKETERVMARRERVAERVAEQNTKTAAAAAAAALQAARELAESHASEMVFDYVPSGYKQPEEAPRVDANGYEFIDESSDEESADEGTQVTGAHGKPIREHKRLKNWGKKNRKLRDKDPYADVNNLVAYSTNRVKGTAVPVVTTGREKDKLMRHSTETAYGSPYVRTVLPHHAAAVQPSAAAATSSAGSKAKAVKA